MADVIWFTFPGCIIPDIETIPTKEELRLHFNQTQSTTSFIKESVICFDGGSDKFTVVCVNPRNPIWHLLDICIEDFRKEFFSS